MARAGTRPSALAVADVNGDGKPDVLAANQCVSESNCANGSVGVLLGNGDGTFQTAVAFGSGGNLADSVAAADVNGDGKPDLIVANQCITENNCTNGVVGVLFGNGDGTFQTAATYASGLAGAYAVAVADMTGNGNLDLVVANCTLGCDGAGSVGVLLGTGDGTFQPVVTFGSGGAGADSLAVADVNGDGKPDVLVATFCNANACTNGTAAALINESTPVIVVVAPTSLNFGSEAVNATSAPQLVTLTNLGKAALTVSIGINGPNSADFSQTNNCGTSVPAAGTCNIKVTFTPAGLGSASASLNVTDDAPGSPQTVALSGSGSGAAVSLSPPSVGFPNQYVGTSGLPQTVTVTNTGNATLNISNVTTSSADFGSLSNCTNPIQMGEGCTIGVFFDPTASGARNGTLLIRDNAVGGPQSLPLSGMGQNFSVATSGPSSATVTPGEAASYTVTVAPAGGFNQTVALACSGAPPQSVCSLSADSVTLRGSAAASVTVTITTAGSSASLAHPVGSPPASGTLALWLALSGGSGLTLLAGLDGGTQKVHRRLLYGLTFLCLFCIGTIWCACGGGSLSGTPAGTYNPTVTGSFSSGSTSLNHAAKLTLIVQ